MNTDSMYHSEAVVHLDRMGDNLAFLKEKIHSGVKQLAVVKADAYGHGAETVARYLQDKVDWFATASVHEAVALRDAGIRNPILVFAPPFGQTAPLYETHRLTAVVSHTDQFEILPEGIDCHLQFDTGMGRFGMNIDQVQEIKNKMAAYPGIHVSGIMTHYAGASEPGSETVGTQLKRFLSVRQQFDDDLLTHTANSGGILYYPETHFDMVRHGIAMYGYPPGETRVPELKPVLEWRSFIIQCKPIKAGMPVSYLGRWKSSGDGYLGVVPVGYADGLPRNLSGKIAFQIGETTYPAVGIITMDYTMIYLGKDRYDAGTPVQVMGHSGHTADDWGKKMQTISYEILCRINPQRVRRLYLD